MTLIIRQHRYVLLLNQFKVPLKEAMSTSIHRADVRSVSRVTASPKGIFWPAMPLAVRAALQGILRPA